MTKAKDRKYGTLSSITSLVVLRRKATRPNKPGPIRGFIVNGVKYTCTSFYANYPDVDRNNFTRLLLKGVHPLKAMNPRKRVTQSPQGCRHEMDTLDKAMPVSSEYRGMRKIL